MSKTAEACLSALRLSVLIDAGTHWLFVSPGRSRDNRRRLFNRQTVNQLLAAGLAVRDGNIVRAA